MIPSRTVFDTWRTESVGAAGHTLGDSGEALDDEVAGARYAISRVAQDGLWSGVAAQSGETATDVGCRRATALSAVARNSAIGVARSAPDLTAAASRIRNLLTVIESGDLLSPTTGSCCRASRTTRRRWPPRWRPSPTPFRCNSIPPWST
ncbi:hypothetical protein ACWPN4_02095 [Gordonia polyisoprenivorans]